MPEIFDAISPETEEGLAAIAKLTGKNPLELRKQLARQSGAFNKPGELAVNPIELANPVPAAPLAEGRTPLPPAPAPAVGLATPATNIGLPSAAGPLAHPAAGLFAGQFPQLASYGGNLPPMLEPSKIRYEGLGMHPEDKRLIQAHAEQRQMNDRLAMMNLSPDAIASRMTGGYAPSPEIMGAAFDAHAKQVQNLERMLGTQGVREVGLAGVGQQRERARMEGLMKLAELENIRELKSTEQLHKEAMAQRFASNFPMATKQEREDWAEQNKELEEGRTPRSSAARDALVAELGMAGRAAPLLTPPGLAGVTLGQAAPGPVVPGGAEVTPGQAPLGLAGAAPALGVTTTTPGSPTPGAPPGRKVTGGKVPTRESGKMTPEQSMDEARRTVDDTTRNLWTIDPQTRTAVPAAKYKTEKGGLDAEAGIDEFIDRTMPLLVKDPDYFDAVQAKIVQIYGNKAYENWVRGNVPTFGNKMTTEEQRRKNFVDIGRQYQAQKGLPQTKMKSGVMSKLLIDPMTMFNQGMEERGPVDALGRGLLGLVGAPGRMINRALGGD